jgi:hypothetical protein
MKRMKILNQPKPSSALVIGDDSLAEAVIGKSASLPPPDVLESYKSQQPATPSLNSCASRPSLPQPPVAQRTPTGASMEEIHEGEHAKGARHCRKFFGLILLRAVALRRGFLLARARVAAALRRRPPSSSAGAPLPVAAATHLSLHVNARALPHQHLYHLPMALRARRH